MNAASASKAYTRVGVESGVSAADPHKLISMLYQGALVAIANAKNGMMRKDVAVKGMGISKATLIIDDGLNASLDKEVGGELAINLSSLYDYMVSRLVAANLNDDLAALDEVARLLNDLKSAWDSIRPDPPAAATPAKGTSQANAPSAAHSPTRQPEPMNKIQLAYGRV